MFCSIHFNYGSFQQELHVKADALMRIQCPVWTNNTRNKETHGQHIWNGTSKQCVCKYTALGELLRHYFPIRTIIFSPTFQAPPYLLDLTQVRPILWVRSSLKNWAKNGPNRKVMSFIYFMRSIIPSFLQTYPFLWLKVIHKIISNQVLTLLSWVIFIFSNTRICYLKI